MDQQSFKLAVAASHHIQSFNFMVKTGIDKILTHFVPMELNQADIAQEVNAKHPPLHFNSIKITFSQVKLGHPYRFNDPTAIHQ